jgi:hypothetical protein
MGIGSPGPQGPTGPTGPIGPTGTFSAGTGTADYLARWTSSTTLGTGVIQDDGTNIGISSAPNGSYKLYVNGNLNVNGTLSKLSGSFKIDHPLDPMNKYLYHSFVESPDMMNIYNGIAVLDKNGEAIIKLADWFEALNKDFRYQLTCIGGYAPVYIAKEISDNSFKISGGYEGLKVSWQVTGIRHDTYAKDHPIPVEENKSPIEKGKLLYYPDQK